MDPNLVTVASAMGLPLQGAPSTDVGSALSNVAGGFATEVAAVLVAVDTAVADIARVAYVTCLLVGFLLYFTHIGRRLGKDLIIGGILLVAFSEWVFPALISVTK